MSQRDRIRLQLEESASHQLDEAEQTTDSPQHTPQIPSPVGSMLHMQRTLGNQAVQRMLGQVQRVPFEDGGELSEELSQEIHSQRGQGATLDSQTAATMGAQLGGDFSGVNVHTDATADRISRSIGAKAFTTGNDIFFKGGSYNPGSSSGQELLRHELTHVQQQEGKAPTSGKLAVGPVDDPFEAEAEQASQMNTPASDSGMQRQAVDEEEEMLQQKRDDLQRQDEDEDEETVMQMRDDVQREKMEEEEMLQQKRDDLQRQAVDEEEEETVMQMRDDVQRQEDLDEEELAQN